MLKGTRIMKQSVPVLVILAPRLFYLCDRSFLSDNGEQWTLCHNKTALLVIPTQRNGHSSYLPSQNKPVSPLPWQSQPEWAPLRPPRPALFPLSFPAGADSHSGAARFWSAPLRPDSPHPPPQHPLQHLRRCETNRTTTTTTLILNR